MIKETIVLNDKHSKNIKDSLRATSSSNLKGSVEIYEKKNGVLEKIREKHNLIVYGGRNWLLQRAFGSSMTDEETNITSKVIRWFGVGEGGGEPGNPLQAGATYGQDSALLNQSRLRSDLIAPIGTVGDPGYSLYASDISGNHGYYKKFSSVIVKEDISNPYTDADLSLKYPPIIAEIRIELTSDDASSSDGGQYTDINEAALFVSDPTNDDPGSYYHINYTTPDETIGTEEVLSVTKDGNYAIYKLNTTTLNADMNNKLNLGDKMYVTRSGSSTVNTIPVESPLLIVDIFTGEIGNTAYVVVEKADAEDETVSGTVTAHFKDKVDLPYTMFSRVTFSTIRKTIDREIVFLWRIYF